MSIIYELRGVDRRYGKRPVFLIESLVLETGRIYTLTGANGTGKTTLLQTLAFLHPPNSGDIFFRGKSVDWAKGALRRLRLEVTLLQQSPYLFFTSVFENVTFGLKARGVAKEKLNHVVTEALEQVGLAGFQMRRARELSGGEAQRVAMARALVLKPAVLLLDEPLANVDQETSTILVELIRSLPNKGTTVIMTTHDPNHVSHLNSHSIHLEGGRITTTAASSSLEFL